MRRRRLRMLAVLLAMAAIFFLLAGRLIQLMLFSPEERLQSIRHVRRFFSVHEARRGNIYDRNGGALAVTVPAVEIGIDPRSLGESMDDVLAGLAAYLPASREELRAIVDGRRTKFPQTRWVSLADRVPEAVFEKIQEKKWPGVHGQRKFLRFYPQHSAACHVVGFLNRDGHACCGVEKFADFFLQGQDGWVLSEKDGRRQELRQFRSHGISEKNGHGVYLTIDLAVQRLAEEELDRMVRDFSPDSAVIIVGEAGSGKLLALACWPNYDPNDFSHASMGHLRNRAICDCYEPGSVFKIVAVAAGLEEGIVLPGTIFHCAEDHFVHEGHSYPLPHDHSNFGDLTLTDVLRKSSNRGSAQIAIRLGPETFYSYVRRFGFGECTGYGGGCDGEIAGILQPPQLWDGLTITRMPMGHAIAVTPLQIHQAMGVLAADGYLVAPQLVEKVVSEKNDEKMWQNYPVIRHQVLGHHTVVQLRAMLANPLDDLVDGRFPFACKTGTSQKIVAGRYVHDRHVASCSGFFPADRPKFVITVVVDSPKTDGKIGWGSRYAKPTFRYIAEQMARMGVQTN